MSDSVALTDCTVPELVQISERSPPASDPPTTAAQQASTTTTAPATTTTAAPTITTTTPAVQVEGKRVDRLAATGAHRTTALVSAGVMLLALGSFLIVIK